MVRENYFVVVKINVKKKPVEKFMLSADGLIHTILY